MSSPIFQPATFEFGGQTDYHELQYIRLNNTPNHIDLHEKLAPLEDVDDALVTSSAEERIAAGIKDELIRLSIGVEDAEDLIADLGQALEKI